MGFKKKCTLLWCCLSCTALIGSLTIMTIFLTVIKTDNHLTLINSSTVFIPFHETGTQDYNPNGNNATGFVTYNDNKYDPTIQVTSPWHSHVTVGTNDTALLSPPWCLYSPVPKRYTTKSQNIQQNQTTTTIDLKSTFHLEPTTFQKDTKPFPRLRNKIQLDLLHLTDQSTISLSFNGNKSPVNNDYVFLGKTYKSFKKLVNNKNKIDWLSFDPNNHSDILHMWQITPSESSVHLNITSDLIHAHSQNLTSQALRFIDDFYFVGFYSEWGNTELTVITETVLYSITSQTGLAHNGPVSNDSSTSATVPTPINLPSYMSWTSSLFHSLYSQDQWTSKNRHLPQYIMFNLTKSRLPFDYEMKDDPLHLKLSLRVKSLLIVMAIPPLFCLVIPLFLITSTYIIRKIYPWIKSQICSPRTSSLLINRRNSFQGSDTNLLLPENYFSRPSSSESSLDANAPPADEVAPMNPEYSSTSEDNLCRVCYYEPRSTILQPCGHVGLCTECASKVDQCPFCRANVTGFNRAFLV